MSRHEWTLLAVKLLALYLFVQASTSVGFFFPFSLRDSGAWTIWLAGLGQILTAVLLWAFAPQIARHIWKNAETSQETSAISLPELQAALFAVVGLAVLVTTVPGVLQLAMDYGQAHELAGPTLERTSYISQAASLGVRLLLSLWLLLDSQGIVGLLQRVRTLGVQR